MHVMRATVWHGGLRKHKWEYLMNAGFDRTPGIAVNHPKYSVKPEYACLTRESATS